MRSRHTFTAFLATVLVSATAGIAADPIRLASYEYHIDGGRASSAPISQPWQIAFILQVAPPSWEPYPQTRTLGGNVFWAESMTGAFSFNSNSADAFDDLVSYATNGLEDGLMLWALDHDGGGSGSHLSEESVFQGVPDLQGYHLESIVLTVSTIHFQPWMAPSGEEGYLYTADTNWSFYGTPIPETHTMLLILASWPLCVYRVTNKRSAS